MHVAFEPQKHLFSREGEVQVRALGHLRLVFFLVATGLVRGNRMHVMHQRIRILDRDLLPGLSGRYIRRIKAIHLIDDQRGRRRTGGLAGQTLQIHHGVRQTLAFAHHKKRGVHRLAAVQLAAGGIDGDRIFSRRRAVEFDGAGEVASGDHLRGKAEGEEGAEFKFHIELVE